MELVSGNVTQGDFLVVSPHTFKVQLSLVFFDLNEIMN